MNNEQILSAWAEAFGGQTVNPTKKKAFVYHKSVDEGFYLWEKGTVQTRLQAMRLYGHQVLPPIGQIITAKLVGLAKTDDELAFCLLSAFLFDIVKLVPDGWHGRPYQLACDLLDTTKKELRKTTKTYWQHAMRRVLPGLSRPALADLEIDSHEDVIETAKMSAIVTFLEYDLIQITKEKA